MMHPRIDIRRWIATALVAAGLVASPGCVVQRFYASEWPEPVEAHRVRTSDGWELDLRRVRATGGSARSRPVIAVHGIVTNGRNVDLDEKHSLARHLAAQGFDVWVPSLRGVGLSEKRAVPDGVREGFDFDAYVERDLAAILAYVRAQTGASEVDYVGHSMGGMVLYAHLARGGAGIGRAVTLGSPVRFRWGGRFEGAVRSAAPYADWAWLLPLRVATHATLPVHARFDGPVERLLANRENIDGDVWRRFLAVGVDDVPAPVMEQFAGWVERGRFDSADRSLDYFEGLANVRVPMLVVSGKVDGIAPPWAVRPAYERLGSTEKRWLVAGEANGMKADYNHMDLLLGERAPDEIFRLIADFLSRE